jgi:hypothetical protein
LSSSAENVPAAGRTHPCEKTVSFFPVSYVRLKSVFRHVEFISKMPPGVKVSGKPSACGESKMLTQNAEFAKNKLW